MPKDAIKAVAQKPSTIQGRQAVLKEQKLVSGVVVRYRNQPDELEGGRRRATDSVWSLQVYLLGHSVTKPDEPVLNYLLDGSPRGFVREELLVLPDTQPTAGWGSQALENCFCYTRDRSTLSCHGYVLPHCPEDQRRTAGYPLAGNTTGAQYCMLFWASLRCRM